MGEWDDGGEEWRSLGFPVGEAREERVLLGVRRAAAYAAGPACALGLVWVPGSKMAGPPECSSSLSSPDGLQLRKRESRYLEVL
jgi:hypothetical protein